MKTIICLLIVSLGIIIAIPLTVLVIAWEIADESADWIRKQLTGTESREEMEAIKRETLQDKIKQWKQSTK
jgi:hypothetical protein